MDNGLSLSGRYYDTKYSAFHAFLTQLFSRYQSASLSRAETARAGADKRWNYATEIISLASAALAGRPPEPETARAGADGRWGYATEIISVASAAAEEMGRIIGRNTP